MINDDDIRVARIVKDKPEDVVPVTFQNFSFPGNQYYNATDKEKIRLGQTPLLKSVKTLSIRVFCTFQSSCHNKPHLMNCVGFLFKQFLPNGDFCLGDPGDLVPFTLHSGDNDD